MDGKIPLPPAGFTIGGIKVMCDEYLPEGWMVVSQDVYKLLTVTSESQQAEMSELMHSVDNLNDLIAKKTGGL